jgi:phenylalanyl-tRNA synthetase beta chain
VEEVVNLGEKFKGVVVGEVLSKKKHPDADRLSLAEVNIGSKKLRIVCGASNLEEGQKVPVALVGSELPNGMKIEKAEIRGEASEGMICSEKELGLAQESEGIMVLEDAKAGEKFSDYLGMDDCILDIDNKSLTHRADLFSHIGLARELSAMMNLKLNLPKLKKIRPDRNNKVSVEVKDRKLCPRYMAVTLDNVRIGESPKWIQARLAACGMRPINNIVDITNYVMLEYGQPLHAFSADKIEGKKEDEKNIIVRQARKGETLVTIDGKKRELDSPMLVIADSKKPIAVAGVMGGNNSEVEEKTKSIILESANFEKNSVRKTAQKLGLHTDAATRFEKGLSLEHPEVAIQRAVELFEKHAGAKVSGGVSDTLGKKLKQIKIKLNLNYAMRLIGIEIPKKKIVKILKSLEFKVKERKEQLEVLVPLFRTDIFTQEDLIEEIARVYGYGNIKPQEIIGKLEPVDELPEMYWGRKIAEYLEGAGFSESYNYSFYGEKLLKKCMLTANDHLIVENAQSSDLGYLRTTLLPRLMDNAALNFRNFDKFKIFEIGHVYFEATTGSVGGPIECKSLSGIVVGNENQVFYEAKGALEFLLEKLGIEYQIEPLERSGDCEYWNMYEEGKSIQIKSGKDLLGTCSVCDQRVVKNYDIKNKKIAFFNLSMVQLVKKAEKDKMFKPLPKYPLVTLDLAFVLDKNIPVKQVENLLYENGKPLLRSTELFDIYEGKNLEEGKKSLAFHLTYRSDEKTLTDKEVEEVQDRIIKKMESEFGVQIRK